MQPTEQEKKKKTMQKSPRRQTLKQPTQDIGSFFSTEVGDGVGVFLGGDRDCCSACFKRGGDKDGREESTCIRLSRSRSRASRSCSRSLSESRSRSRSRSLSLSSYLDLSLGLCVRRVGEGDLGERYEGLTLLLAESGEYERSRRAMERRRNEVGSEPAGSLEKEAPEGRASDRLGSVVQ